MDSLPQGISPEVKIVKGRGQKTSPFVFAFSIASFFRFD